MILYLFELVIDLCIVYYDTYGFHFEGRCVCLVSLDWKTDVDTEIRPEFYSGPLLPKIARLHGKLTFHLS